MKNQSFGGSLFIPKRIFKSLDAAVDDESDHAQDQRQANHRNKMGPEHKHIFPPSLMAKGRISAQW
jgi:hypothetical protein